MTDQNKDNRYDEIDLRDLARTLIRRKWLILATAAVCLVLAMAYGASRPDQVVFTTVLEIGQVMDSEGKVVLVEDLGEVKSMFETRWAHTLGDRFDGTSVPLEISTSGQSLTFSSQGDQGDAQRHASYHRLMADVVLEELNEMQKLREPEAEQALSNLNTQLSLAMLDREQMDQEVKQLETQAAIQARVLAHLTKKLDEMETLADVARQGVDTDAGRVLARMMLINEYLAKLRYKAELEIDLLTTHPRKQALIQSKILVKEQDVRKLEEEMARFPARRDALASSRVLSGPGTAASIPGRAVRFYAALGLVAGGMLGVFGAFFAEFVAGLREPGTVA